MTLGTLLKQIPSTLTEWPVAQQLLLPGAKRYCKSRPAEAKISCRSEKRSTTVDGQNPALP